MITPKRKEVYNLTDIAEIRFKRDSLNKPVAAIKFEQVKGWTNKMIQLAKQKIFKADTNQTNEPSSPTKVLKGSVVDLTLSALLNSELLLVGNSRKLDLIHIDVNKEDGELEVRLVTQFFTNYSIKTITLQRKKQFVIFNGDHHIELYVLNSKTHSLIKKFVYSSEDQIRGIQLIGDSCLLQYHDSYINILGLQNWQPQVIRKISYDAPPSFKVFKIPTGYQNYGNIFLFDENEYNSLGDQDYITLHICQIVYQNSEFKMSKVEKLYDIFKSDMQKLIIYNYNINTVLFDFINKIVVIKNHYPIDELKMNYADLHSKLYFLENKNIIHFCDTMIQSHTLQVHPSHAIIKCFDRIKFSKPTHSKLLSILSLHDDKFVVIFKLDNKLNTKETKYWITATIESSIKIKLESIFEKAQNNKEEIFESALKMGMTRNQIFYQLWMRSARRSKEDFDILLQTEDYKTITDGIRNVLKKQSIGFKQLVRIQKQCLTMLQNQIKRPTETNLVQYLKCSFSLRKYRVEERLETQKKKKRDQDISPNQRTQVQLSIQQYQDIRKRNIKNYLLFLMKKCDQDSITIIKQMVDIFRLTLRHIIPTLMTEVVGELKEGLLGLLQLYPQLLPLAKDDTYGSSSGIWADILKQEWQNNIYFENLKNVDNVQILESLMTKDYFKWDWLVEHDFFKVKRDQFEIKFKNNREKGIFYIFFSELFLKVTNEQILDKIIQLIQTQYQIPEHLVGKTKLYWKIHKFFQTDIPDYNLTFQNFLSLHEDQIYRIIFSKNKKALVLKDIKKIYNSVCDGDVYDNSILCYFKADYSSLADLKYLLNRVNSEKQQFHNANQNLYKTLVDAVHYKLRWDDDEEPPLNQIMVYYYNILLKDDQINQLKRVEAVESHMKLLRNIGLKMNLKQLFDDGILILNKIASYLIDISPEGMELETEDPNKASFDAILQKLLLVRDDLYSANEINDEKVLEILVSNCLNYDQLVNDIQKILTDPRLLKKFHKPNFQSFLENIIREKVEQAFKVQSNFPSHEKYITGMIKLLNEDSVVRIKLSAHLQLGLLLSVLSNPPRAPLIISSRFFEDIISNQNTQIVKRLDIFKIYDYMFTMGITEPISNLYQVLIIKYLNEGEWAEAMKYTELWNQDNNSITFSAIVMLRLAEQLSRDLRSLIIDIVIRKFNDPHGMLELAKKIIDTSDSKDRRRLIQSEIQKQQDNFQQNYQNNSFINAELKNMVYPDNEQYVKNLFEKLMKSDMELQNNYIYNMYYRIFMCDPVKAAEFFDKNFDFIDVKVLKVLIIDLSKNLYNQKVEQHLKNRQQLYLYIYKCLLVSYSSNYLSREFKLQTLLKLTLKEIDQKYYHIIEQLETAMHDFDQKDRLAVFKFFRKLHLKSMKVTLMNHLEMSDEEDKQDCTKNSSSAKAKNHPLKTKKSLIQMISVDQDRNLPIDGLQSLSKLQINKNYSLPINPLLSKSLSSSSRSRYENDLPLIYRAETEKISVFKSKRGDLDASPSGNKSDDNNLLNSSGDITKRSNEFELKKEHPVEEQKSRQNVAEVQVKEHHSNEKIIQQLQQQSQINENNNPLVEQVAQQITSKSIEIDNFVQQSVRRAAQTMQQKKDINSLLKDQRFVKSEDGDGPLEDDFEQIIPHSDRKQIPAKKASQYSEKNILEVQNISMMNSQRNKRGSDFSQSLRFSNNQYYPSTDRQIPQFDQSKLENSQISSLYPMPEMYEHRDDNVFTINIKDEEKLIESQKINVTRPGQKVIADIIKGDYVELLQEMKAQPHNELQIIKECVNQVFEMVQFGEFVNIVEKLRELSNKYLGAVKAQNFKVIKNAYKTTPNLNLKQIFTPEILYITSPDNNVDETNKLIFKKLKPKIMAIIEQQNVFMISKAIYFSLHYNKSFEFRVQYYYLEKLFKEILQRQTKQELKMDLEKIQMLLNRLPINMTTERVNKMLIPLSQSSKVEIVKLLLRALMKGLQDKIKTPEGEKYLPNIELCLKDLQDRLEQLAREQ